MYAREKIPMLKNIYCIRIYLIQFKLKRNFSNLHKIRIEFAYFKDYFEFGEKGSSTTDSQ